MKYFKWSISILLFLMKKYKKYFILTGILFVVYNTFFAQHENITFEHFTVANGLSAPVTEIIQDHYGFLWLGTTDGLNRFDGRNFIVYRNIPGDTTSIANNIVNAMCVDSAGRLWVATNGGLCFYDFSDNAFHQIEFNDTLEKIDRHRVHAVCNAHDNGIWFATKTMLHKWQPNQPVVTIPLPYVEALSVKYLIEDDHRQVWIGESNGLLVYNEQTKAFAQSFINSSFSLEKKLQVTVHPIIPFTTDTFFIGTWYGGLQKVYLSANQIQSEVFMDDYGTDPRKYIVSGISKSHGSQWWIGTYGTGLSLFDSRTGQFIDHFHHNPSDAKSLSDDYVNDVFTDASGIVWIGTAVGLDKFDPLTQQFHSVPVPAMTGEFSVYRLPRTIVEDVNHPNWLWITVAGAGLFHYNTITREFRLYNHDEKNPFSLPENTVYTFYRDRKGRNWVAMKSGLCWFDEEHERFIVPSFQDGIMPQSVHRIEEDDHGYWMATFSNGVYYYDKREGKFSSYRYQEANSNSLPDDRVFCMTIDHNGKVWIGTQNRGLCRLDPSTGQFIFFQHDKKNPQTIPDNGIYDLYEDENHHLWIATENGLADMDLVDFKIKNYSTLDGLCNNDIFSITPDLQHKLWFATNNGVSRFDPLTSFFKNYFVQDGLPENSVSGAGFCTSSGELFFGTSGVITFCNPENMKMNRRIPPVVITNFKIFDQQAAVMRNGEMLQPVHLSYKENMITFDFAALNFTNSTLNQYAYKLEGFNSDWIYCGNKQSATFTNLNGGTYTFRVKAANNDGIWNEAGTHVQLIVDPPYWKTWWFYLLCTLLVAGILYLFYRFRINQLLRLQQIRLRIARDLHDDIGSTLSSINMISSMANQNEIAGKKSSDLFQTISSASRQAMELMNDIVWSINPKNDRMDMIIIRMRQYASEMLEAAQIPFTIDMDDESRHIVLPIEKRKDFYLIFKEGINNLAKYSSAGKATIQIKYSARMLTMILQDNGKGFDINEKGKGNGLKNIKARAEMLKGDLSINSKPGEGTLLVLHIPVTP
jgi:ligand-binding sensor domain-containing protein/two-component sensor histidine kinase